MKEEAKEEEPGIERTKTKKSVGKKKKKTK
jgi:hypothetical protein